MQEVIEFETKLANITIPAEDRRDEEKMYHQVAVAELQEIAPFVSLFVVVNFFFFLSFECKPGVQSPNPLRHKMIYCTCLQNRKVDRICIG